MLLNCLHGLQFLKLFIVVFKSPFSNDTSQCNRSVLFNRKELPPARNTALLSRDGEKMTLQFFLVQFLKMSYHCLEAGVQLNEEWGLAAESQDSLLHHSTLDVVVLYDDVLLQDFDGVQFVGASSLG